MKKLIVSILIIAALFGAGVAITAELQPITFMFTGRWQPSEDPVLLDDNGLQDIQNLRKVGKHFKGISGHTAINATSISASPYFLNGFHFRKDQPQESHVLIVSANTATPTASYLYQNTTAIPGTGELSLLYSDTTGGMGTGRFSVAPQGNMVYANGAETLIWGGNELEATAFIASQSSITGTSVALTYPIDYSDQVRNTQQTADQVASVGSTLDSYVKMLLHADGVVDGSTVITDAASTTRTVTAINSAQVDTAQYKFASGSVLFASATSDYLTTADSPDWDLGAGDFTIEAWLRLATSPAGVLVDATTTMTSANTPAPNVVSGSTPYSAAYAPWKSFSHNLGDYFMGDAATGGEFLKFDFGAASITATSYQIYGISLSNPKTWTFSASTDNVTYTDLDTRTNQTLTGGAWNSYSFTNTTAYRYYKITVTAGEYAGFTIAIGQMRISEAVTTTNFPIIAQYGGAGSNAWNMWLHPTALFFSCSTDGTAVVHKAVNWVPLINTWYHVAVARNGNNLRFFVNGTQQGATQDVTGITISNSTAALTIGYDGRYYNGWMDELRLSKGVARWTSDFTPPSSKYLDGNKAWFVGSTRPLQGVKFYVSQANTETGTLSATEWNGSSWSALAINDETAIDGKTLAQTGKVTWSSTVNTSKPRYMQGISLYWYQFTLTSGSAKIYYATVDAPMQTIKNIWDGRKSFASSCLLWNATTNYIDYTSAVSDDSNLIYLDVSSLTTNGYVLTGFTEPQQGFEYTMVATKENATTATTMAVSYWDGTTWTGVSGLYDGTATGTTSLSKSGVVTFSPRAAGAEFQQTIASEAPLYYYKTSFGAALDSTTQIAEIRGIPSPQPIGTYKFSETYQNRLFLFNEVAGAKNKAVYSVDNSPDLFNGTDSGALYFGDNTELVAAAAVYNVMGNEAADQLIIGKKNEVYRLTGNSPETWVVKRISANVGVIAPLSMVSCEISGNTAIVIWQSDKGFYMTDGSAVIPISDDIRAYFDPNDSRYIPTARRSKTVAWYDPSLRVYKALISSGSGQIDHNIELEYSLTTKEWTKIHRDSAAGDNPLQCGFQVWDTNGIGYTYGGDKTGFLYRLENGNTFAGTAIIQFLQTKDMILDTTAPFFRKSSAKYLRTAHKKKTAASGGGTITVSHYGDQILSVDGTSNQIVPDAWSMATSPYNTQSIALGPALYHSFKFTTSDTTATDGMELIGLGIYAEPYTAMR